MPTDERVLCIPSRHFDAVGRFFGFRHADASYHSALLNPAEFSFQPRKEVETDPAFKQLIPYVVLTTNTEIFHYQRGAAGTEKRLEAKRSIGVGGHISELDAQGTGDLYRQGLERELAEEVQISTDYSETILGYIYDDRSFVGSVHLGIVHRLHLQAPQAIARESGLQNASFSTLDDLMLHYEQFETWSQFVLDILKVPR